MAAETWFSVGDHDVFPEQFPEFLGLSGHLARGIRGPAQRSV